jgi:membrane fusion protein
MQNLEFGQQAMMVSRISNESAGKGLVTAEISYQKCYGIEGSLRLLFRAEALKYRVARLEGDVALATPFGWQIFGYLLLSILLAVLTLLVSGNYSRVEIVGGQLVPDKGIAVAVPTRPGVLSQLLVKEGQQIDKGAVLANVIVAETQASGQSAQSQIAGSLQNQDRRLLDQSVALNSASVAERARLSAQINGLQQELLNIAEQITVQRSLVSSAQKELDQAQGVAARGFISRRDMLLREEQLAVRQQQLSGLGQTRASKLAQLQDSQQAILQTTAQAAAQAATLNASREQLTRQQVDVSAAGGYSLAAPTSGTVTAITAKTGQVVGPNAPLLSIIPAGSKLRAEVLIPTSMIGFVRVGQEVKVAIDAFPYQQYGTIKGRIASLPGAPSFSPDAKGNAQPVYLAVTEIDQPYIMAFGKKQPLLSGMTLSARITTRKQSLWEWLFEPLYAVGRR